MRKVFNILGMLVLLVGSVYLDQLFYRLENLYPNFRPTIPFWTELPVYLVFAFLLLALAWILLIVSPRSLRVAFSFIGVGLFGLVLLTRFGFFSIWPWINKPPIIVSWLSNIIASPLALTRHAAAMILVIGLVRLLPEKTLKLRSA